MIGNSFSVFYEMTVCTKSITWRTEAQDVLNVVLAGCKCTTSLVLMRFDRTSLRYAFHAPLGHQPKTSCLGRSLLCTSPLHQSYGYGYSGLLPSTLSGPASLRSAVQIRSRRICVGREHVQNTTALRDHFANSCNMRASYDQ